MVKHPDTMDDETFIAHLNARHMPFAGLAVVDEHSQVELFRRYHQHVHYRGADGDREVNHEHRGIERAA